MATGEVAELRKEWASMKEKCIAYDKNLQTLKNLAKKALIEFDQLKAKYKEARNELMKERDDHASDRKQLQSLQAEIKKLKHNTAKAFDEYGELQAQLELEKGLRSHAESLASEVVTKNKKLRNAGKSLLELNVEGGREAVGENIGVLTEAEEGPEDVSSKLEELNDQVNALSQELESTRERLRDAFNELEEAKQKLIGQEPAGMTKEQEEHIKKVSQIAYDEYQKMEEELKMQTECREQLEEIAAEVVSENKAIRRKSHALLTSANEDEKTKKLAEEVANLSKKLELQTVDHKREVNALKGEIDKLKRPQMTDRIQVLEAKLSATRKELDLMERRAMASENRALQLEAAKAERPADERGGPAPAPPPPAPPPPVAPPPPAVVFKPISEILKGKSKKPKKSGKDKGAKDPRVDAMTEMINRIKGGVHLKKTEPSQKKSSTVDASAMAQLASQFKLKKRSTVDPPSGQKGQVGAVSDELAKKLRRMKDKAEDQPDWTGGDDELPPPPFSPPFSPSVSMEDLPPPPLSPLTRHLTEYEKRVEEEADAATKEAEEEVLYADIGGSQKPFAGTEDIIYEEAPTYDAPRPGAAEPAGDGGKEEEEVLYEDAAAAAVASQEPQEDIYETVS